MAVNYDTDTNNSNFVSDADTTLGRNAVNEAERRRTLLECINDNWSSEDIGCIERIENKVRWGWILYPYRA